MNTFSLRLLRAAAISVALVSLGTMPAISQDVPAAAPAYTPEQLEKLVGPIALYSDPLLAITLPSATYPLDLVKGQRFLERRKKDPKAEPDKSLPDPVLKLLNYPEVVKMMNDDLDWTEALGEAVDTNEAGVMDAIQAFRRKAQGAGNLTSNDKQVVVVEEKAIVIQPANPEVIYVPQYQPSTVVVHSSTPYVWGYYPTPYPYYAYPYAPGAALATGLIVGAAIGGAWGMGWNNGSINNNINIDRTTNINTGNRPAQGGGAQAGNRPSQGGGGQNWRNDRAPTQTKAGASARQGSVGSRPGDARAGGGGASARPTSMGGGGASARPTSTGAGSVRASSPASNFGGGGGGASSMQSRSGSSSMGGGAFGGAGSSGASANRASSRGASSMNSSYGGGGARAGGGGGGGARAGGGGGGGRGGGGGGRGGGGRR